MKKHKWIIWLVAVLLAGASLWFWKFRKQETHIVLNLEKPYYGNIANTITATGTVQPVDTVAVGTQVSGIIQSVYVDFNSPVKKGELLAQLDRSLLQAQVLQIAANLQAARANVVYQKSNYQRQNHLYEAGAISRAEQENALYQYQSAVQNVSSISAQLSSAKRNLSYTSIYSPIQGTVLSRNVSEGQTVAATLNTPTLFSIAKDLAKMQVQASIDEADIGNVKKGQRVQFTVDAFPSDTFTGTVKEVRLRSSVSANVVSYTTIIDAPNADLKLKPGMTASITVYTKEKSHLLLLPAKAFSFQPDSILSKKYLIAQAKFNGSASPASDDQKIDFVWVNKDDRIVRQPVVTGMNDETEVEIVAGLAVKDEVVTGYQQLGKTQKSNAKSPFMPTRPRSTNRRSTSGPPT